MHFDFMKPEIWDGLVLATIIIGSALAALRLYADLSRSPSSHRDDSRD
ncbi:MAG TPA: hypothetical protein PKD09_04230 [Aggregatilinea sp.]|jgi:hypothetical protein|nr:hypothetical protein [Aggregatilinea sp.]HML20830.1 hypothetical protein [Aggregatilinea sp.]